MLSVLVLCNNKGIGSTAAWLAKNGDSTTQVYLPETCILVKEQSGKVRQRRATADQTVAFQDLGMYVVEETGLQLQIPARRGILTGQQGLSHTSSEAQFKLCEGLFNV
jgi:hypothetical protein